MDDSYSLIRSVTSNRYNKRGLIILGIDVIILMLFLKLLPFEEKVNAGLATIVFIGILWLTEAIHVTITALCIPIFAVSFGFMNTGDALKSFASPIIFLFFGGFALSTALHIQGLDRLIANRLLVAARGRLSIAVFFLFGITAVLSMWISNIATAAMMLPLVLGVLSNLDVRKERNTFIFVLLGIAYSASIGGLGTIVGSPPNAIAAAAVGLNFLSWMKYGIPIMVIILPMIFVLMYLMLRPNLKHRFEPELKHLSWNSKRITAMIIFLFVVISWSISSFISNILGGVKDLDTIIAIIGAILIAITGVANWSQIQKNTEWGVLMLFGGGLTLNAILISSGANNIMANWIQTTFGQSHWFVIILAVSAFIVTLTEFTSNTASAALLVPIFATVAESLGMPVITLTMIIGIGASCAFMLPVATPPNAIVFGSGYIKQIEMVRVGVVLNIACVIVISLFAWIFWT
ncbi:Sodium:sulfate symporter transmembrane region family protein [Candidatus Providencia siddallii]|uniref:Sodium:sulfate symporter transmembrane region family protein n=1 Tax=Candidatus Providencia siddallii TaxID=1715285 RepID=A0A0M6WAE2_9GAMM|nr:Sodium:sulfate symporter transmembrane region family protein [Candidatus Providencia siddallii]